MTNPESIKDKLKAYSKSKGKVHQNTIVKFFQERLLFRLSKSKYKDNFLLKGGALAYTFSGEESRHTKDIDFLLTKLNAETEFLKSVFAEITAIDGDDGVIFKASSIKAETITKEGNYSGTRIKIEARLSKISQQVQVDIGVGDYVTPGPQEITYPTILAELEAPKLLAYSIETLVAEKFNAMIDLGVFNSRLKDFYDIYKCIEVCNVVILEEAINNTFKRRETGWTRNHSVFQDEFYTDKSRLKQWGIFLKKNQLESIDFASVKRKIIEHLFPIYEKMGIRPTDVSPKN
jgi:predicted nucleotidyltransferase component of viral defense system